MDENMRSRLAESVRSFHIPRLGEIPDVGLYLEQVTRYVNQSITGCGLSPITASMVSNYVKQEEADILIKEDEKKELRSGCVYETEMRINLKKSTADKIRLNLRMSQGKKTEILFDLRKAEAYFDRNNSDGWSKGVARCPLNLMGKEHLDIHIYSDKISLEIFSNDYQNNFSCNIYNVDDDQKNEMTAIGGDLMIESIRSWELEKTMK